MHQLANAHPFDEAVAEYVAGLDEARRSALCASPLNPQSAEDRPWFAEVIERFRLRDKSSPVRRDINERVEPDPLGINTVLWSGVGNDEPLFEALRLLDEARRVLLSR